MSGLCSVSVDLDPLWCYSSIHSLDLDLPRPDPIYTRALPRLLELFATYGIRATFFVVGREVEHPEHARELERTLAEGHELANHSYAHPYNFPELSDAEARHQIERAHTLLETLGEAPVGFRAPGYNIDARTLGLLEELGYTYDSSIFPCPPYYLAKGAVMAMIRLRGGTSGSSMVQARTQIAPITPYRPSRRALFMKARGSRAYNLMELPMCVLPIARFPVIGTSLLLAGPQRARWMCRVAATTHRKHFNLELHGIDLADATLDAIPEALRERQPDLKIDLEQKLETFHRCFELLAERYAFAPCREAAERLRS